VYCVNHCIACHGNNVYGYAQCNNCGINRSPQNERIAAQNFNGNAGGIMLTIFSTLVSFLMGGLPKILDFFQDKSDKKHELELARMQTERELQLAAAGYAAQQKIEDIKLDEIRTQTASQDRQSLIGAQQAEMQAIYAHDTSLNEGTSQWMKNLRASVRPVITYGFFFLLVGIDAVLAYKGITGGTNFDDLANQLWDDETQALFAAIISFHFGGRAFGK
jgi:hypothetical protein